MGADMSIATANITKDKQHWLDTVDSATDQQLDDFLGDTWVTVEAENEELRTLLRNGIDACYSPNREIVRWKNNGETWAVTGGLSWGDSPTDIYDTVGLIGSWQDFIGEVTA